MFNMVVQMPQYDLTKLLLNGNIGDKINIFR